MNDEREWEAQERGMRAARGQAPSDLDPLALDYRKVANAVISHPVGAPPGDFVARAAAHVARHEGGIERPLSGVLLAMFAVALVAAAVVYGARYWQVFQQPGEPASGWMLAGFTCVALSWVSRQLAVIVRRPGGRT
ncbi:hypothetical protein J2T07_000334 [Luteibacter jiangsuensis]|uniref:Uncharacterized protein n=1 Tax=Luteibacter jiangsuensis TaxID=637577 RepID=A0ABT9ST61_9GAMM|nr:hypothetical protein [Luteibacter jiangsuensis]MDQ0008175.1 hypothetical protein [Luteibacter jiangsuensis]